MEKEKFAKLVKKQREKAEMTQFDFAVKVGVSLMTVHRWENALSMPTPATRDFWINKIMKACK